MNKPYTSTQAVNSQWRNLKFPVSEHGDQLFKEYFYKCFQEMIITFQMVLQKHAKVVQECHCIVIVIIFAFPS